MCVVSFHQVHASDSARIRHRKVRERDVDLVWYSKPYWVGAAGEQAQRPYALLVEALARHGTVAVAKVALRTR